MLLNWADMHTDGKGNRVSFDERLDDIRKRYGSGSDEYLKAKSVIKHNKIV